MAEIEIRQDGDVRHAGLSIGTFIPSGPSVMLEFGGAYDLPNEGEVAQLQAEIDDLESSLNHMSDDLEEERDRVDDLTDAISNAIGELSAIQMEAGDDEALKLKIQGVIDGLK